MRRGSFGVIVGLVLMASSLAGCSKAAATAKAQLLTAIGNTALLSNHLSYLDAVGATQLDVDADIEDGFRYQASLSVDGTAAYQEIARDDALAARLLSPVGLQWVAASPASAEAGPLASGGWVVDELGAPVLTSALPTPGADPILDALSYFSTLEASVEAAEVVKFDPNALDYRPDLDPFPRPGPGVIRYDLTPGRLPTRATATGPAAEPPGANDLEKLSVYVHDGLVVAVRDQIAVEPFVQPLERAYAVHPPGDADQQAAALLSLINGLREAAGVAPIVPRSLTLMVTPEPVGFHVVIPPATVASLKILDHRGSATGQLTF